MPLPDADPDKRMYKLLKNIDLENLSFADFQTTAQTVFAEPEAEDTLRRIVLINLARMSVAGDWNGLTTSASGGGASYSSGTNASFDRYNITKIAPFGAADGEASTMSDAEGTYPIFFPFVAPFTGDVSEIGIGVTTAGSTNLKVGIYSATNALPGDLMGSATIDLSSTGAIYQTSLSATVSLVLGTTYWIGTVKTSSVVVAVQMLRKWSCPSVQLTDTPNEDLVMVALTLASSSQNDLPSSVTANDLSNADSSTTSNNRVNVTVK